MHVYIYTHIYVCVYVCICMYVRRNINICTYAHMHTNIPLRVYRLCAHIPALFLAHALTCTITQTHKNSLLAVVVGIIRCCNTP